MEPFIPINDYPLHVSSISRVDGKEEVKRKKEYSQNENKKIKDETNKMTNDIDKLNDGKNILQNNSNKLNEEQFIGKMQIEETNKKLNIETQKRQQLEYMIIEDEEKTNKLEQDKKDANDYWRTEKLKIINDFCSNLKLDINVIINSFCFLF